MARHTLKGSSAVLHVGSVVGRFVGFGVVGGGVGFLEGEFVGYKKWIYFEVVMQFKKIKRSKIYLLGRSF